ncbi:uncharacterized protein EI90DRAFT_2433530 [Cantharellus anzutake]|uniref:uncharacterized protein n=1 Tax=Cantharellus anzutake TaxID=1750568 RepID=UPI001905E206|nr:uncharacterized protein EI90DRAFT_2433530 [Cantharellus anzutake]KAF8338961.1 hypothetical protein EI90DRAFT_2433530 [Cantharellus anzutake]
MILYEDIDRLWRSRLRSWFGCIERSNPNESKLLGLTGPSKRRFRLEHSIQLCTGVLQFRILYGIMSLPSGSAVAHRSGMTHSIKAARGLWLAPPALFILSVYRCGMPYRCTPSNLSTTPCRFYWSCQSSWSISLFQGTTAGLDYGVMFLSMCFPGAQRLVTMHHTVN